MEKVLSYSRGFLLLAGLLLPLASPAGPVLPKAYQIELIIFSHITHTGLDSEQWPLIDGRTIKDPRAMTLAPTMNDDIRNIPYYTLLPPKDFTLKREQARLNKHPTYHTLLHIAWRQPVYGPRHARPIRIYGGYGYSDDGNIVTDNADDSLPYRDQSNWQVNGTMTIGVRRYFDVNLNLTFAAPINQIKSLTNSDYFSDIKNGLVYFRLLQNRRTRSKELNYIDHPLYGILIKVTAIPKKTQPLAQVKA